MNSDYLGLYLKMDVIYVYCNAFLVPTLIEANFLNANSGKKDWRTRVKLSLVEVSV